MAQQSFSRSYTYDELNRIKTMAGTGGSCTGLTWSYDVWGNRTNQTVTGGSCTMSSLSFNIKNQISNSGFVYDAAGNLINEPGKSYQGVYPERATARRRDAENRLLSVNSGAVGSYDYGPNGERVRKVAGGATTYYFRDLGGQVLTELWPGNDWTVGYIYLNGQLLAQYSGGTTYFAHKDHLGSTRLLTKVDQTVHANLDYLPFGEESTGGTATTHKFTGHERDSETGLDFMGARYYASNYGRFPQPDALFADQQTGDPQSWNMYTYVRNNPLVFIDPTGNGACPWSPCTGRTATGPEPSRVGNNPYAEFDKLYQELVGPTLAFVFAQVNSWDLTLRGRPPGSNPEKPCMLCGDGEKKEDEDGEEDDQKRPSWVVNDYDYLQVCIGPLVSGCVTVTQDIHGGVYVGGGVSLGKSWPIPASIFGVGQRIEGDATRKGTRDFISGLGVDATAGLLFGYSESYRFFRGSGQPSKSTGKAIVLPAAFGVGVNYTVQIRPQRPPRPLP